MSGSFRGFDREFGSGSFVVELDVSFDRLLPTTRGFVGSFEGHVTLEGNADQSRTKGIIEVAPFIGRRIRYRFDFAGRNGTNYRFDGEKSIDWFRPFSTLTTLNGQIFRTHDSESVAEAMLRFDLRRDFTKMLGSLRA